MIKNKTWEKNWAGGWSLLTCGYLGYEHTKLLKPYLGKNLKHIVIISHKGYSTCYFDTKDKDLFGKHLSKQNINKWCQDLYKAADNILKFIKENKRKKIDQEKFIKFIDLMKDYGRPHRGVKVVVDYLPPKKLEKLLPKLEAARIYSEPVYTEIGKFIKTMAKQISPDILNTTPEEFAKYWKTGKLPSKKILRARYKNGALVIQNGTIKIFSGKKALAIEKQLQAKQAKNIIQGQTAYPGKTKGVVRIILDPHKAKTFNQGNILVTGMTRPEYLNLVKKSSAFITDAGGMLSHAAITARELKKPCIVGTEIATKQLKDGDKIEIDANKGIIKIL